MRKAKRLPLELLAPYILEPPAVPRALDWAAIFGNDRPVEMEVGFGKGAFLVAAGQARPAVNLVGVEIDRALQLYVATRLAKRSLHNVRVIKGDARHFIRDIIHAESLAAIHVYFPDPWWKTRHKKRRVFTADFAAACQRALRSGGRLYLATDVEEYFHVMTELVKVNTHLRLVSGGADEPSGAAGFADLLTNFERKAQAQGRAVWRASYDRS